MKSIFIVALAFAAASAVPTVRNPRILDSRIIGGEQISIEQAPFQISLRYYGSHICGGSVISPNRVVTAAHCTDGSSAAALSIRAGSSNRLSGGVEVPVSQINQNPQYNGFLIDFDISVLTLASNLVYSNAIQPVGLPELDQGFANGASSFVTGWGSTAEGGSLPQELRGVTVQVVSAAECANAYGASSITRNMLCAGVNGGGKDACQGDSGGPLIANGVLAGLTSWGYGCARPNYPGVYSHVGALRYYIREVADL